MRRFLQTFDWHSSCSILYCPASTEFTVNVTKTEMNVSYLVLIQKSEVTKHALLSRFSFSSDFEKGTNKCH